MLTKCKYCEIGITQKPKQKQKKFCSDGCRFAWWNTNGGLAAYAICANCGREFNCYGNKNREYCNHACYISAHFGSTSMAQRAEALKLYAEGHKYTSIAKLQGISVNTVKSWIRRYGDYADYIHNFDNIDNPEINMEADIENIELCLLREAAIQRVFIVCGPLFFSGKVDAFAARIPRALEYNLAIGDVFVFCNRTRRQLSVLQWQGQEFALMFKRTEEERYPWPNSNILRVIEITESDLRMLIEYPRFLKRLSGIQVPQVLV